MAQQSHYRELPPLVPGLSLVCLPKRKSAFHESFTRDYVPLACTCSSRQTVSDISLQLV